MPQLKKFEKKIERFYRLTAIDNMLYGWVEAERSKFDVTIDEAILHFMAYFDLDEDAFPLETGRMVYHRIKRELDK